MSYEWMVQKGFPAEHMEALRNAPPGASVVTDGAGTRVQEPSGSFDPVGFVQALVKDPYFDPSLSTAWTGATTPATLVRYDAEKQVSNTLYSTVFTPTELEAMPTTIAIFISSAYRETGNGTSRAGYGVSFGPGSKYNAKGVVDCGQKQTSQTAEITAMLKSLEVLNEVWKTVGLMEVVIITDSDYLVKSMCEHIWKWLKNGFKTSRGRKVENEGLLRNLHEKIEELRGQLIGVKFWQVKRSMNKEAAGLANEALDWNLGREA